MVMVMFVLPLHLILQFYTLYAFGFGVFASQWCMILHCSGNNEIVWLEILMMILGQFNPNFDVK